MSRRVTIEEVEKTLGKTLDKVDDRDGKKVYRKRKDLPDPSKPAHAEVNRNPRPTKVFNARVSPEILDRLNSFHKASGKSKREIVEEALEAYFEENALDK